MEAMSTIDEAVAVHVPVSTAYDQWTQFESFPRFMEGVEDVTQIDDTHVRWRASIGGVTREWTAEIVEQVPDQCIAWTSVEGHPNRGEVRFEKRDAQTTLVHLHMEHEPETTTEAVGDWLGLARRRARGDLERFRELIEHRGKEEGAWRGEVHHGDVTEPDRGSAAVVADPRQRPAAGDDDDTEASAGAAI
jgi:uncharacterized membrane protein